MKLNGLEVELLVYERHNEQAKRLPLLGWEIEEKGVTLNIEGRIIYIRLAHRSIEDGTGRQATKDGQVDKPDIGCDK